MKSKAFWGFFSAMAASLPLPALAGPPVNPYILVDYHEQTLYQEVISGETYDGDRLRVVTDPTKAALRKSFEFPIEMSVDSDSSITTSHPISERYTMGQFGDCNGDNRITLEDARLYHENCNQKVTAWAEEIRECMNGGPVLIRDLTGNEIYVFDQDGNRVASNIVLNSSGKAVCREFIGKAAPVSSIECRDVVVETFVPPVDTTPAPVPGLW